MKQLFKIIQKIQETSSGNEKIAILKEHSEDKNLKIFFRRALDPVLTYGVKKVVLDESLEYGDGYSFENALELLEHLAFRVFTGNKAISEVLNAMKQCTEEERFIFTRMLLKDPACGVSVKTVNKVWPGMIEEAKLLKAKAFSMEAMKKIHYPAYYQTKADGMRCLGFSKRNGLYSSSLAPFSRLDVLCSEVSEIAKAYGEDVVVDGELLVIDSSGRPLPRKIGNGILLKSLDGTITDSEAERVRFVIWDVITQEEYDKDKGTLPYMKSMKKALGILDFLKNKVKRISFIKTGIVQNFDDVLGRFREALDAGEEGIMIKNFNIVWKGKRLNDCVKFKIVIETTMKVTAQYNGTPGTKYENCLGMFTCVSEDEKVKVDVGSGLEDSDRLNFWENTLVGKFVEIRSNGLIVNEAGENSLYLPRFVGIREDKLSADTYETIKALSDGSEMFTEGKLI